MSAARENMQHMNEISALDVATLDTVTVRRDFPILQQTLKGGPLIYLDNGATTQKPAVVIDAVSRFYQTDNANVHRGVHELSLRATRKFDAVREQVRAFLNAKDCKEIIFVRGATEAINLVAQGHGRKFLKTGDEILITEMEHHSNIVPWQMLCQQTGAELKVVPMNDAGELLQDKFEELLGPRTRIFGITHLSNALGTINPLQDMIRKVREFENVMVIVDGAQAAPHIKVDVRALDCDFYTLSGHKIYAPTGIGVLYGKLDRLKDMDPYHGGGDMIRRVSFEKSEYAEPPAKFEAGTPDIGGVIGLGAALSYVNSIGLNVIAQHETDLLDYATESVSSIDGLNIIGTAKNKASILSFTLRGAHAHDIGTIMDSMGIAIRAGHHCAMPVMQHYGVAATSRAAFAIYNTRAEIDALVSGIHKVKEVLGR